MLTFFGLTLFPINRLQVFTNIHEIVYYGNGGYSWDIIYNMPIPYRKFIYNQIKKTLENKDNNDIMSQLNDVKEKLPINYKVKKP